MVLEGAFDDVLRIIGYFECTLGTLRILWKEKFYFFLPSVSKDEKAPQLKHPTLATKEDKVYDRYERWYKKVYSIIYEKKSFPLVG